MASTGPPAGAVRAVARSRSFHVWPWSSGSAAASTTQATAVSRHCRQPPLPSAAAPHGGPLTAMPTISICGPTLRPGPACCPGAAQPTVKASLDASLRRRSTGTRTGGRRAGREPDQGFILADVDVEHEKEGSRSARREALKGRRNRKERRSSGLNDPARPAPGRPAAAARFRSGPAETQTRIEAASSKGFYGFRSAA